MHCFPHLFFPPEFKFQTKNRRNLAEIPSLLLHCSRVHNCFTCKFHSLHYNNTKPNPNSLELEWVLEDIDRWFTGWRCCFGSCVWGITASC
ncbi:hypothetical protein CsSME_00003794 [Camellia sinensis var. sinensis]